MQRDTLCAEPDPGSPDMAYWLMKSEPDAFSIDDLAGSPDATAPWDGVRNYQARNMLRDQMQVGDQVLFYHSSCAVPGVAGLAEIVRAGYPDPTAWQPDSPYFDPKSSQEKPRWYCVDVRFTGRFEKVVPLSTLRGQPELSDMPLLRPGNRLSVMPVEPRHWAIILHLAGWMAPSL